MGRIAVVVVNYNTREALRACLDTVSPDAQIVVVDNGSSDGSVEMVAAEFPHVEVLVSSENRGYGSGANLGVAATDADYVLVLNSDTLLARGALAELRAHLDSNSGVGLAAPRLRNEDGSLQPSCFPLPGTLRWLLENDPVAPLLGMNRLLRGRLYRYSPPTSVASVPWVLGAALAVRREAFAAVGGFDEAFFMYYEEVDLCCRLRGVGWDIHYLPQAEVVHLGAASTSQRRAEMAVAHFRSTLQFYRRYYGGARLAFWIGLMRAKMVFRYIRDSFALLVERSPPRRVRLRENVSAWQQALQLRDG